MTFIKWALAAGLVTYTVFLVVLIADAFKPKGRILPPYIK